MIIKLTKSNSKIIKYDKSNKHKGYEDIQKRIPDVKKIKKLVNWEASTNLKEGLVKMLKAYEKV